ncbi:hypothetical protein Gorai_011928 [Gossypium raimondii]|uniref:Uncharacterized protein n=1 Tax=Gossypium raimondii TaxID=29730 RepID=A0A7J8Q0J4_GOSRA|nr:hypothetical protein [Gossypium raimondii]
MAKDIRYMQTWGEVAPALLISRQRSSSSPRLETIVEEERGGVHTLLDITTFKGRNLKDGEHETRFHLGNE